MKEQRLTPIKDIEYMTPGGPYRFNFNHSVTTQDETLFCNADFVEVAQPTREAIISALIRTRYTNDAELALHRKVVANEAGALAEFEEYNNFVNHCKQLSEMEKPTMLNLKAEIQTYLYNRGIQYSPTATKEQLLQLI
jgi:hypothetical protein